MNIIADENIPFVTETFQCFGTVTTMPAQRISQKFLAELKADVLLVRSVTSVDSHLLDGTNIRFVATATIGVDHIDEGYLNEKNIGFANAPGSNAESVAEYVVTALSALRKFPSEGGQRQTVGIVGYGNVGKRVYQKLKALGDDICVCDPFVPQEGAIPFCSYKTLLQKSDIITFHVPLTRDGEAPTFEMFSEKEYEFIKNGITVINTSRGKVIEENSLLKAVESKKVRNVILDVWYTEPNINREMLQQVTFGTPHIAGYSYDGKVTGTAMIFDALCEFLNKKNTNYAKQVLEEEKEVVLSEVSDCSTLFDILNRCYPFSTDHENLQALLDKTGGEYFTSLRKNYPKRLQFNHYSINKKNVNPQLLNTLQSLEITIRES